MTSLVDTARNRLETAQAALDDALRTAGDTSAARQTRDAAQVELDRVIAATRSGAADVQDQTMLAIQTTATDSQTAAECTLQAEADSLTSAILIPCAELPASLALGLANAQHTADAHRAKVDQHAAELAQLRGRLAALISDRQAIVDRRARGEVAADDGAALALLDADREGVAALIEQHSATAPAPDTSRLSEHRRTWDRAIAAERGRLLYATAVALDARLSHVLEASRGGPGPFLRLSPALERALRGL
jgi:hypothetical protein